MPYLIPRSASVTLDDTGSGQVEFQIDNTNQRWIVDSISVFTSQAAGSSPVPQAMVFLDDVAPLHLQGGTNSGSLDTGQGSCILYPDNMLIVVWSGGIPGSTATAVISGSYDPAGVPLSS